MDQANLYFKKKANDLNINQSIFWLGKIKRIELFELFKKNDLLIFPSLRDSGGLVVLEAMSYGLTVATLNIGGPGQIVNNDCGIKINVEKKGEDEIIIELSSSINYLISNRKKLNIKKQKSVERVSDFSWKKKAMIIYAK